MPIAVFTISIPDDVWLADVTRTQPGALFRVLSVQRGSDVGVGLVEVRSDDTLSIISAMSEQHDVHNMDLLWKREEKALLQVETSDPQLLEPVSAVGIPLQTPFTVTDGTVTWEIATSQAKLSALGERFDSMGIAYEVRSVRELGDEQTDSMLTDRQEEVLRAAFEAGYYDTPREATLTDVADELGVSKATCSDVLHRAEGKIISSFLSDSVG